MPLGDDTDPHALFASISQSDSAQDDPLRVLLSLNAKYKSLADGMAKLNRVYGQTSDPRLRVTLTEEIQSAGAERAYCEARMEAIRALGPFTDPHSAEERLLLDAIRAVGAAVASVSAVAALIDAVRGLVAAYAVGATEG